MAGGDDWDGASGTGWLEPAAVGAGRIARRAAAIDRRVVVVAVAALVMLVSVLGAAGLFDGAGARPAQLHLNFGAISKQISTAPSTSTQPPLAGTLKPGDSGSAVVALQRALASLGFGSGAFDGHYGPATTGALKRFQASAKLKSDGILGPQTLRALNNALKGP